FLSANAEHYLKKYYKQDHLPEYARVNSKDTSMLYLNLFGKVHMVEGSHSFKLQLFDKLPTKSNIATYNVNQFEDSDLRKDVNRQYYREFNNFEGAEELTHDVHLNWQHKAIQFLVNQGVSVSVPELIGKERYRDYKEKFGVDEYDNP
ncbi:MAG: EH signature domain-containing protein, partial [Enterovibrio sp.]